ncbi:MAG: DJ-1/PfpI family protein [Planctomycetes bacterium]|nr:DJ-1/PfpI family protein [Planctomycetota bacterium]
MRFFASARSSLFLMIVAAAACATHGSAPNPVDAPFPLMVPKEGSLPVAFVLGEDAEVLDFTGPLEVFAGAVTADGRPLFRPYFVAATLEPVVVGGGMRIVPDYTFANAPAPKAVVIPAMTDDVPEAMLEWIRRVAPGTDVTMSVCNGAFVLARTGLLDGRRATAHHGGYFRFAGAFPKVKLERGARFVEDGNLASAGGISSGIDLAIRVVERYLGRESAEELVEAMEYQGNGWRDAGSNGAFARFARERDGHPICPLCQMEGDPRFQTEFRGHVYLFCSAGEKTFFDTHLEVVDRFLAEDAAR